MNLTDLGKKLQEFGDTLGSNANLLINNPQGFAQGLGMGINQGVQSVQKYAQANPLLRNTILNPNAPMNPISSRIASNPLGQFLPGFAKGAVPFAPAKAFENIPAPQGTLGKLSYGAGQLAGSMIPFSALMKLPAAIQAGSLATKLAPPIVRAIPRLATLAPAALRSAGELGVAGTLYNTLAKLPEQPLPRTLAQIPGELAGQAAFGLAFPFAMGAFTRTAGNREIINEVLNKAKTQEQAVSSLEGLMGKVENGFNKLLKINPQEALVRLKATRAALTKSIGDLTGAGNTGSWKMDYHMLQSFKDHPEMGKIVTALDDQIARVDDLISQGVKQASGFIKRTELTGKQLSKTNAALLGEAEGIIKAQPKLNSFIDQGGRVIPVDQHLEAAYRAFKGVTGNKETALAEVMTRGNIRAVITPKEANFEIIGTPTSSQLNRIIQQAGDRLTNIDITGLNGRVIKSVTFKNRAGLLKGLTDTFKKEVESPAAVEDVARSYTQVKNKVNLLDYLRTPENVLRKIGLGNQADLLRKHWDAYQTQLPEEINKIQSWISEAPGQQSSQKIFNFLDGKPVSLQPNELKVATEVRSYLKDWAIKLGLPPEKQISSYITHIFEKGASEAEFNDEVAKLIDQKVAGSVYNPFLQSRVKNDVPYIQDVWRALQAYTKRAVRAYNMDPALEVLKKSSDTLELSQYKYVSRLTDRINMRPTEVDTLIDNLVKNSPVGYRLGQRPVATISKAIRQQIYLGGLGVNVSSALRNITQGVNTYAKLGERWTVEGYLRLAKNWNSGELERVGVLRDSFIEDKNISAFKSALGKMSEGLMYLFSQVEKLNRGSAYFGAKAKALAAGLSEERAIGYATKLVRDTQFVFGSIDTPVAMQSDMVKTLTQFQTYGAKQVEFLAGMVKNKEYLGLIRYLGATLVLMKVFKDQLGIKLELLPQFGLSPATQIATNVGPALFGSDQAQSDARKKLISTGTMLIPGGVQMKKTYEGLSNYAKGESTAPGGGMRFPIQQTTPNLIKSALLGRYAVPESSRYYDSGASVLGKNQSEAVRQATDKQTAYEQILEARKQNALLDQTKEKLKQSGQGAALVGNNVLLLQPDGSVKTIDLTFQPQRPQLTGNALLDKKIISKFNGQLTQKGNDLMALVQAGYLSPTDAEAQLKALVALKQGSTAIKKPKKILFKITKAAKFVPMKMLAIKPKKLPKIKIKAVAMKPKITKKTILFSLKPGRYA